MRPEVSSLLIDAGPDFRQQMLKEHVMKLDAILLTHEHKDHIAGLDDVRAFNYRSQDAIDIFSEERVLKALKKEYSYVFSEFQYPGIPKMRLNAIDDQPFAINGIQIMPVRVFHYRSTCLRFQNWEFCLYN